jgi:hypothetical protein
MNDPDFVAVVSARLEPVLAPRGFPYAARENGVSAPGEAAAYNPDSVLFHCDGPEAVEAVMARYPGWATRLRAAYVGEEIICLDLWVQQDRGIRSWSFEVFEDDVAETAGAGARQRLDRSRAGPLEDWVDQLAVMLDRYFTELEAGRTRRGT